MRLKESSPTKVQRNLDLELKKAESDESFATAEEEYKKKLEKLREQHLTDSSLIAKLTETNKNLAKKVEDARANQTELTEKLENAKKRIEQLENQIQTQETQPEKVESHSDAYKNERIKELEEEVATLKKDLETRKKENDTLNDTVKTKTRTIEDLEKQLKRAQDQGPAVEKYEAEHSSLKEAIDDLSKQLETQIEKCKTLERENEDKTTEIASLKRQIQFIEKPEGMQIFAEIDGIKEMLKKQKLENDQQADQIKKLESENNRLLNEIKTGKRIVTELDDVERYHVVKKIELENLVDGLSSENYKLATQLSKEKRVSKELSDVEAYHLQEKKILVDQVDGLSSENKKLSTQLTKERRVSKELSDVETYHLQQKKKLDVQVDELTVQVDDFSSEKQRLSVQLKKELRAEKELNEVESYLLAEKEKLQKQLEFLLRENEDLFKAKKQVEEERELAFSQIEVLKQSSGLSTSEIAGKVANLTSKNAQLQKEKESAEQELNTLKPRFESILNGISKLQKLQEKQASVSAEEVREGEVGDIEPEGKLMQIRFLI